MNAFFNNPIWPICMVVAFGIGCATYYESVKDQRPQAIRECAGLFGSEEASIACARAIYGSDSE